MFNAMNAVQIFGYELPWDAESTLFWLLVIVALLVLVTLTVLIVLIIRTRNPQVAEQPVPEPVPEPEPEPEPEPVPVLIPEPVPVVVEEPAAGTLRFDRSFAAKYIQSEDEVKAWYGEIKNDLLSYKKVRERASWKHESYRFGREPVAKIAFRGKTMCLFLPLHTADFAESKYKVEDVSDMASLADTPCMYRIKNYRRVKYAKELIAMVMQSYGVERIEREPVDYYEPFMGIVELIDKGLIKRKMSTRMEDEFLRSRQENAEEQKEAAVAETSEAPAETV